MYGMKFAIYNKLYRHRKRRAGSVRTGGQIRSEPAGRPGQNRRAGPVRAGGQARSESAGRPGQNRRVGPVRIGGQALRPALLCSAWRKGPEQEQGWKMEKDETRGI